MDIRKSGQTETGRSRGMDDSRSRQMDISRSRQMDISRSRYELTAVKPASTLQATCLR